MKIGIDARMYQESGVGRYIRNLISKLERLDKENEYFIFLLKKDFDNLNFGKNFTKILADFRWYGIAEQTKLPGILKKISPDLVHFPHFNIPVTYKGKFAVTIHDLIHQHFQMRRATTLNPIIYKFKQFGYRQVFKKAILASERILTPSKYVKDLLVNEWRVSPEKVVVTYEACDDKIMTAAAKMSEKKTKNALHKLSVKKPYIFYVGNAHPHKNVEGLIKVFLVLKKAYQDLTLVLSGSDHYFWQRIKKEFKHKDIIYTGWVTDIELVALYKNAKVFVIPSFEEGFGIPLLEAMVCSCPVVSSKAGALFEVGGDACVYFDPHNIEDMVEKISQVLNSENLRKDLIKKGLKRYKQFSWEELAKQTMEVYLESGRATLVTNL